LRFCAKAQPRRLDQRLGGRDHPHGEAGFCTGSVLLRLPGVPPGNAPRRATSVVAASAWLT
jgi:hypothetical protein